MLINDARLTFGLTPRAEFAIQIVRNTARCRRCRRVDATTSMRSHGQTPCDRAIVVVRTRPYCRRVSCRDNDTIPIMPMCVFAVKPTSINITTKPKRLIADVELSVQCEVVGSVPDTDIRWTQNNRQFERGQVSGTSIIADIAVCRNCFRAKFNELLLCLRPMEMRAFHEFEYVHSITEWS